MSEIDHLAYVVPDLESAVARIGRDWGCAVHPGGRHPAWGSWNAIVPLTGGAYLEVVAPHADPPESGRRVFGLDEIPGAGLRDWAIRPSPGALGPGRLVKAARAAGVELGEILPGSRETADGTLLEWALTDPFASRLGGTVPFVIDWGDTPHPSGVGPAEVELVRLEVAHPDPDRVDLALSAVGVRDGVTVRPASVPALALRLRTPRGEVEIQAAPYP